MRKVRKLIVIHMVNIEVLELNAKVEPARLIGISICPTQVLYINALATVAFRFLYRNGFQNCAKFITLCVRVRTKERLVI